MLSREPDDPSVNKALGLTLMKLGLYPQSIAVFDKAESIAVFDPDIPFFSAVAELNGKRPNFNKRSNIDNAIAKATAATLIEPKAIYDYFLSVIKFDYFYRKGFSVSPDYEEHMENAENNGLTEADIDLLNEMMKIDTRALPPVD